MAGRSSSVADSTLRATWPWQRTAPGGSSRRTLGRVKVSSILVLIEYDRCAEKKRPERLMLRRLPSSHSSQPCVRYRRGNSSSKRGARGFPCSMVSHCSTCLHQLVRTAAVHRFRARRIVEEFQPPRQLTEGGVAMARRCRIRVERHRKLCTLEQLAVYEMMLDGVGGQFQAAGYP